MQTLFFQSMELAPSIYFYFTPVLQKLLRNPTKTLKCNTTKRITPFKANHMRVGWELKYKKNPSHYMKLNFQAAVWSLSPAGMAKIWAVCDLIAVLGSTDPKTDPSSLLPDFTRLMKASKFPVTYCSICLLACVHIFFLSSEFCKDSAVLPDSGDNHCSFLFFFWKTLSSAMQAVLLELVSLCKWMKWRFIILRTCGN